MIGYRIKKMQSQFFTADAVVNRIDSTTQRALSMFGAFVRRTAKKSIRKSKKVSDPGKPPNAHTGLIGRFLYFAYDDKNRSVVIGPAGINSSYSEPGSLQALEYGGRFTLFEKAFKTRSGTVVVEETNRAEFVRPRPFMNPAFQKELPGLSRIWDKARR
jgi:hypothetical protein